MGGGRAHDGGGARIQVADLATGAPAWWGRGSTSGPSAPVLVLDPAAPETGAGEYHGGTADWLEWGSYVVLPKAGCCRMTATWPGGSWSTAFAAGR